LLNGGFFFSYLWWLWFSKTGASRDNRGEVLHIFAGIVASLTVARTVQIFLSGRNRPIDDPRIGFVLPYGADPPTCAYDLTRAVKSPAMRRSLITELSPCNPF
jgi:hypothetical protein